MWFQQNIGNACGLHGVLRAVLNGKARKRIGELGF